MKAYQNAARWDRRAEVAPWLIAHRGQPVHRPLPPQPAPVAAEEPIPEGDRSGELTVADAAPDRRVFGREIGERIEAGAPGAARASSARSFVLRHYDEMALEEIAETLGMSLGTVKSSLHRAVRALRDRLEGVKAGVKA